MTAAGLCVRERVQAALSLRLHTNPTAPVAISAICRDADVSRANLYANYPDLVHAIRATWGKRTGKAKPPLRQVTPSPQACVNKELLLLCLELRAEVEALRKRIDAPVAIKRRKT